ncbi:L-histidine N(alpha)-methyltransferase [Neolewinella aurantiaca]|uniref:L-histidine N(Alpha)-methyltransferase n=1 Tax=Neolewinella aurantiaca TaxID=2602767 RepID=A0A5C7FJP7_9BACT|nr:L-histidine N(alpha)-methyltransferase [Neolewinella aurantiaca]TXF90874.1 L-histidine N(alpha)-methyltransferase [Neolewinella aurantiaca]
MPSKINNVFAEEVKAGLSASPRHLSSKWFYDATGDELFQAIMAMPEYYLTDAEREVYQYCGPELLENIGDRPFDLIELGAGDGSKTRYLINDFIAAGANFTYRPIDISAHAVEELSRRVAAEWPQLDYSPLIGDYFAALNNLGEPDDDAVRLVLFPGANIGNFNQAEASGFLRHLHQFLRPGDLLLTGFDLRKDPAVILAAYNDPAGHTADFNLNLLRRINNELKADFDLQQWMHWETYDPLSGAARSYLVARADQTVAIGTLGKTFHFDAWEAISVEVSQKYSRREIEALAEKSGYTHVQHFTDDRVLFSDSLWKV